MNFFRKYFFILIYSLKKLFFNTLSSRSYKIIFFCLIGFIANAQEEFVPPPSRFVSNIQFSLLTGGIIILHCTLDDFKDSLNFVLDTGSGGISLDSLTCEYYNLKTEPSDRIVRGIAGIKYVSFAKNHALHLPGIIISNLDFHINDYEILSSAYGMKIDGIMGYSFLRRYIVYLDYDNQQMKVYTPGTIKYPKGGYLLKPQFSTLPMQNASIKDGKPISGKFFLDTGAGLCLLMNDDFANDSSVFKKSRKFYLTQAEGLGGKTDMKLSVVKELKLGPYKFRNVPAYVFNDDFGVTNYPVLGGLIGNDIMRRFNVIINYPQQEIYIKPNKHFLDSFDYSYTGLEFYLIDGAITITDVTKNSPAEKAGFKEGDIILGIDNNFSNNIQMYKVLLQNAKARINIVVMRKGEPRIIGIRIKSVL